jgi:prepilin-type processing-associated H-X9-DG protein
VCFQTYKPRTLGARSGFTLTELLAITSVLALATLTFLPARAGSRTKAQALRCMSNLREVVNAVTMYTHDNHDLLPPDPDDGTTTPGYSWCSGQAGVSGADEFDPDILTDPRRCLLARYTGTNASVYRCTADTRTGRYDGAGLYPTSPLVGKIVPSARTISMNHAAGTIDPGYNGSGGHSGVPNLPVNGPWLTGSYGQNNAVNGPYRTYGKLSQIVLPTPADLVMMTEEAPFSINDGTCSTCVNPANPEWIDYPSTLHNNGCVLNFADGHVEFHKWVGSSLFLPSVAVSIRRVAPNDPDWTWFTQRVSVRF